VRGQRWSVGAAAVTAIVGGAAAAGCDSGVPDPAPVISASSSVAPARYSGPTGTCPTFTSAEARKFHASGPGRLGGPSPAAAVPGVTTIDCRWAPADARPSVSTSVSIFPNGFPPAGDGVGNAENFYQGLRADTDEAAADASAHIKVVDQRAAGPAFLAVYPATGAVTQTTLADNAVVTVIVRDRDRVLADLDAGADDLLDRVGPTAGVLTGEAVNSLR
jgi:hypothetical protein